MKRVMILLPALLLLGCASTEKTISGKIGCQYDNIDIVSKDSGLGIVPTVLAARCGSGPTYICSKGTAEGSEYSCQNARTRAGIPRELYGENDQSFDDFFEGLNEKAQTRKR